MKIPKKARQAIDKQLAGRTELLNSNRLNEILSRRKNKDGSNPYQQTLDKLPKK